MNNSDYAPILVIIYNRVDKVQKIVNTLNKLPPLKIYIAADGPKNNDNDRNKCAETRKELELLSDQHVVIKKYSEVNLGCGKNCADGITWFFSEEELGIIIEDDIHFGLEFIEFCSTNLIKHKNNKNIYGISGSPYLQIDSEDSNEFLSLYPNIWGWATWRRSWVNYTPNLQGKSNVYIFNVLNNTFKSKKLILYWYLVIALVKFRKLDTWDHQVYFYMWETGSYFLIPREYLTYNIGFDDDATCMKNPPINYSHDINNIDYPSTDITLRESINSYNISYDNVVQEKIYKIKFLNIIKLIFKNIFWREKSWI